MKLRAALKYDKQGTYFEVDSAKLETSSILNMLTILREKEVTMRTAKMTNTIDLGKIDYATNVLLEVLKTIHS